VIVLKFFFFFFQAEDGIRDGHVTGVQTCALPISVVAWGPSSAGRVPCQKVVSKDADGPAQATGRLERRATGGRVTRVAARPERRSEERRVGKEGRARGWWER